MANSSVQLEVAKWIRDEWLPSKYGQDFLRQPVELSSGGTALFDAISQNGRIAVAISTSEATTASGNNAAAKLQKIRADMYFLMLANVEMRLVLLVEADMYDVCVKEKVNGRVPQFIEFRHVDNLPDDLRERLQTARSKASREVTPRIDTN